MREDALIHELEAFPVDSYIEANRSTGRRFLDDGIRSRAADIYRAAFESLRDDSGMLSREVVDMLDLARRTFFGEHFLLGSGTPPTPRYSSYTQIHVLDWVLRAKDRRLDGLGLRAWRAIRILLSDWYNFETSSLAGAVDWQVETLDSKVLKERIKKLKKLQATITAVPPQQAVLSIEVPPKQWRAYALDETRTLALVFLTAFPQTREHDEYLFLRTIHISECCFLGIFASVTAAMEAIRKNRLDIGVRFLREAKEFGCFLIPLFQAFRTMPPEHFKRFRDATGNASAVQSRMYQLVQIITQGIDAHKKRVMGGIPEVADLVVQYESGFEDLRTLLGSVRDRAGSVAPFLRDLLALAKDLDKELYKWRSLHLGIAKQYLGDIPGTGDTHGAAYLERHYKHRIFPLSGEDSDSVHSVQEKHKDMSERILPPANIHLSALDGQLPLPLGLVGVRGVDLNSLRRRLETRKVEVVNELKQGSVQVTEALAEFGSFFQAHGFTCPLPGQVDRVRAKGFPNIMPSIDALLVLEASTGILMGVQNLDSIEGALEYGVAGSGEVFPGMRGEIACREGEFVLRDRSGIIASYFQGPDKRTKVSSESRDLIFFVFSTPGLNRSWFQQAMKVISDTFSDLSLGVEVSILE